MRKIYDEEQVKKIAKRFLASGNTRSGFARDYGVSLSYLNKVIAKYCVKENGNFTLKDDNQE